jgi:DNA repair exonuclease SbcCD ATPase subunit
MADLDAAAAQLQQHIGTLHERVTHTIAQGEQTRSAIDAARGRIEEHYGEVSARATALRASVQERRQHVEGAMQSLYDAAQQLGADSVHAKEQIAGFLQDTHQELQALHDHAEGDLQPALDELLQHARSVHESFGERIAAMQDELGGVVNDAHQFLTVDTTHHLAELKAQVDQGHEEVRTVIRERIRPQLQHHVDDYLDTLASAGNHLQEKVEDNRSRLKETTAAAMQEMLTQFAQHSDTAQEFAHQADDVMSTLKGAIDTGGDAVANGEEVVQTGVDTTSVGLKAVVETLGELKEFLGRFSFVDI